MSHEPHLFGRMGRFVKEYTAGLDRRDLRRLFDKDATRAYQVLTREHEGTPEPKGGLKRFLYRAKLAFLGLSYKPQTPVVEESHSVKLAARLADAGYIVAVHDPLAQDAAIAVLGDKVVGASSLEGAVRDCDLLIVATGWPEYKAIDPTWCNRNSQRLTVLDLWRTLPAEKFGFPNIPKVAYNGKHSSLSLKDYSVQPPVSLPGTAYPELVPKVDADGNDIGGVRSYMLQVPLATYTGWNHRRAGYMEDDLCGLQGSSIPFAKTAADRGADPRPSLQERYGSHANYVAKVEAATAKLVSEGFMLKEDAARVIAEAKQRNLGF